MVTVYINKPVDGKKHIIGEMKGLEDIPCIGETFTMFDLDNKFGDGRVRVTQIERNFKNSKEYSLRKKAKKQKRKLFFRF